VDRLAMLEKMASAPGAEPFARYGLAMEYRRLGRLDDAVRRFSELVRDEPAYVPTYLMYGQVLVELGRPDEARAIFERGIEAARAAGDDHAASELAAARDAL